MASGTKRKGKAGSAVKTARAGVVSKKQIPWLTIISVVAVLALAAVVFGYYLVQSAPKREQASREEAAEAFVPTRDNQDPTKKIKGVTTEEYKGSVHVQPSERVAYDQAPPFGGPHDGFWADCNGVVYPKAVRNENMVHGLEHGAIWIAYDPKKLDNEAIKLLELRVEKKPYSMMSPYPGLDKPISVQSWSHQLKVDDAGDARIDQFIAAQRRNPYTTPEPEGTCTPQPGTFDVDNPPPFDPSEPGKDAKPMDHQGQEEPAGDMGGEEPQPGQ